MHKITAQLKILFFSAAFLLPAISALASLQTPHLPDLEDLALESFAESLSACVDAQAGAHIPDNCPDQLTWQQLEAENAVLAVLMIPDNPFEEPYIALVPCDPKNRQYRFFRDRQPPLGLCGDSYCQYGPPLSGDLAETIAEEALNSPYSYGAAVTAALEHSCQKAISEITGGSGSSGGGCSAASKPSRKDLALMDAVEPGSSGLFFFTQNSNFKLDEVHGRIAYSTGRFFTEVLNEPADWLSMGSEVLKGNGHWSMGLAALPFLSRPVARKIGDAFDVASDAFETMLGKVDDLDFSTPRNKAVFYSGRGQRAKES